MTATSVVFWMIPTSSVDERRQQPPQRLREDHERMAADPAEAERGGRLVLLARDRLHCAARRLGDLRAAPQRQPDRRRAVTGSNVSRGLSVGAK